MTGRNAQKGQVREDIMPNGVTRVVALWEILMRLGKQDRLTKLSLLTRQVADATRNPTMHCRDFYTLEQANDIFQATGAFMRRLAEDFDDGKDTENAQGRTNSNSKAQGLHEGPAQSGESQAAQEVTPPNEQVATRTSPAHHSDGCTATHTHSGRTEDA